MTEYPSESLLKEIADWDILKKGARALANLILINWHWEDYAALKGITLTLHTGGWSGNEDIIAALQKNQLFWMTCWESSVRGGHYKFKIREIKK